MSPRLLALSAAVLIASACGASRDSDDSATAVDSTTSRPSARLLTYEDTGTHMEAAFDDVLSVNAAGCFALGDGSTILLPDTWSVSPDGGGVVGDDGVEVRLGDHFTAGGGYGGPDREDLSAAQRACPSDGPPFANGGRYISFAALWGVRPD